MKNGIFWALSLFFLFANFAHPAELQSSYHKSVFAKATPFKEASSLGELDIEYGINGYIRISSLTRVRVTLKKAKKDFKGAVHLRYYSVGEDLSSYSSEINIKKGEDTTVYFYPFLNAADPGFTIAFLDDNDKEVESFEENIGEENVDSSSELVVASFLPRDKMFSLIGETDFKVKRIYLSENQTDGDYRSLSSFDLVILPDNYETEFKPETVEILKDRERQGGVNLLEKDIENFNLNRLYLGREDRAEWTWKVERILIPVLENLNIKTGRYIVIIFIYIMVVSPITYFLLARRKRKLEYWIFVPIWSVIFTAIVYMVSADSRVDGMYMNYVSVLDLRKDRGIEDVALSITGSSNTPYKLEINNGYKVESLYGSFSKFVGKNDEKVKYNIESKDNGADINVMETSVFDTLFIKARGEPGITLDSAGKIYRDEAVVKGEFNNKLGVNLKKVFAVYDDEIIYIGDVANGESKIFASDTNGVFLNDLTASLQDSVFMNKIFNFSYEGENAKIQTLLTTVLDKTSISGGKKPAFIALADGRLKGEFTSDVSAVNGYTILVLPADKGTNSDNFVNSIGKLPMLIGEYSYSFSNSALLNKNSVDISYETDKNRRVKSLMLLSLFKEELNPCKVYIFNPKNGGYDVVFKPDKDFLKKSREYINSGGNIAFDRGENQVFYMSPDYVKNGKIILRYEVEQSAYDEMSAFSIPNIPKISMEYK